MVQYLTEKQIAEINFRLIERYSPKEEKKIMDPSALNMIVNLPEQYVFGRELYPTIFDKAGVLFVQLIYKHVFANANKRTATFVMIQFLTINHYDFKEDFEELKNLSIEVIRRKNTAQTMEFVSQFLESHTHEL